MKSIYKISMVCLLALGLGACSYFKHGKKDETMASNLQGGTYTQGIGEQGGVYADEMRPGPHKGLLAARTFRFKFDSDKLTANEVKAIKAHAKYLLAHPRSRILLEGNTDAVGSREYNVALGWRRANSVQDILRMQGVSKKQIRELSYGQERPVALGQSETAYAKNRRVDVIYENVS